jgi:sulfate adenylyltransferase
MGAPLTNRDQRSTRTAIPGGGVCIWLTGLSGSGKTTTAMRTRDVIEQTGRVVTLLDGDLVRRDLFPELGFTRADRDRNVMGVAWVASEIVRHGGVVICSLVSPYRAARQQARALVGPDRFLEVFVDTPVEVCQARDVKGLYRLAREGEIDAMTGIDDPYEAPPEPDVTLDTLGGSVDQNVRQILRVLQERGLLGDVVAPGVVGLSGVDEVDRGAG